MTEHFYRGFGFQIQSEIRLPQLFSIDPFDQKADLIVRLATVFERRTPPPADRIYGSDRHSIFGNHKGLGWARTVGDDTLILAPMEGVDPDGFMPFVCGTYMGIFLYLKDRFPLHAGGILVRNRVVLLAGKSGAGKSTTTYALHQMGYPAICDDISPLEFLDDEQWVVHPGTRGVKLAAHLAESYPMARVIDDIDMGMSDKFFAEFIDSPTEHRPVSAIIFIEPEEGNQPTEPERLNVKDAIPLLRQQAYRGFVFEELISDGRAHFEAYLNIAVHIPVYKVCRPMSANGSAFTNLLANFIDHL